MQEGTVKFFNETKGFGFIKPEKGADIFVHISGLTSEIKENDKVAFDVANGKKGLSAVNVRVLDSIELNPVNIQLEVIIDKGTAPESDVADLLSNLSILYRMMGGSGINFENKGVLTVKAETSCTF